MAITKPYDHIMKILARTYPEHFLELVFPGLPIELVGTLDNVELALEIDRVDFLHQVNINGDDALLHIDFEHRHKGPFPQRVFSYNGMLTELNKPIRIISVPIYLVPRQKEVPKSYDTIVGGYLFHSFTYEPIVLSKHVSQIRSGKFYPLAPLLVLLTKNPTTETLLEERELILAHEPDAKRRQTLFATAVLAALAQKIFDPDFIWSLFKEEGMLLLDDPVIGKSLDEIYAPRLAEREAQLLAAHDSAKAAQREEEKKRRLAEKRRRLAEEKRREAEEKQREAEKKQREAEQKQREVEAALREALQEAKRREEEAKRREEEAKQRQKEWLSTTTKFLARRFKNVPATLFLDLQRVLRTQHSQVIDLLLDAEDIATFQQELQALLDSAENGSR